MMKYVIEKLIKVVDPIQSFIKHGVYFIYIKCKNFIQRLFYYIDTEVQILIT